MPELEERVPTAEEVDGSYNAALDSVNLINDLAAKDELTEEEVKTIQRNVEHLQLMVGKDFWGSKNLKPLNDAIASGNAVCQEKT